MLFPGVILICVILQCAMTSNESKKRMMGVDTVHNVIDKDTVINRNTKLETRSRGKIAHHKEDTKPDWSYSSFPEEVASYVKDFKKNMSECLKEVQSNEKKPNKRLSANKESPVHGDCLIACVLKRNGVIVNKKVNKGNLISLVSKFYAKDTKLMKKLDKNLDRCIEMSSGARDECALAARLNDCTNGLMVNNKHKIAVNYK